MDHFLEMIAARQLANVAAAHGALDVSAQEHRRNLADLIDVVALLPATNLTPCDLRRCVHQVEGVGGHTAPAQLMSRDAEVAKLQRLVLAYEHVERRKVAMQRLSLMQNIQGAKDAGDLSSNEALGLRPFPREPGA